MGILFVDGLYKEYLKTNKALRGKINKIQRLNNKSFEIFDISYGCDRLTDDTSCNNDKRELWSNSKNSKEITKIHLNDNRAIITNWRLCKKLHEYESDKNVYDHPYLVTIIFEVNSLRKISFKGVAKSLFWV